MQIDAGYGDTEVEKTEQLNGGFYSLEFSVQQSLVKKLIRLMLMRNTKKKPVRRDEITKFLFDSLPAGTSKTGVFKGVMTVAKQQLRDVFGMEMVEVQKRVKNVRMGTATQRYMTSQSSSGGTSGKGWILRSLLSEELRAEENSKKAEMGFLMVVAGMIMLETGCRMEAEKLYKSLERVGCCVWEKGGHKQLNGGNVKELLEKKFINMWYLEREKDGDDWWYRIGDRLMKEVSDDDLVEFVNAVYCLGGNAAQLDDVSKRELKEKLEAARGEGVGEDDENDHDE